jgi:hypothetical protein
MSVGKRSRAVMGVVRSSGSSIGFREKKTPAEAKSRRQGHSHSARHTAILLSILYLLYLSHRLHNVPQALAGYLSGGSPQHDQQQ